MLADPCQDGGAFRAPDLLVSTVCLHVYVEDVDAQYAQAIKAGAKTVKTVEDQFYGDRSGTLQDPFGHIWCLATHKEDLAPDELAERAKAFFKKTSA